MGLNKTDFQYDVSTNTVQMAVAAEEIAVPKVELDAEKREIEAEGEDWQKGKELEALPKEKRELAERKKGLSGSARPSTSMYELDDEFRKLEQAEEIFKIEGAGLDPKTREEVQTELKVVRRKLEEKKKQLAIVEKRPFVRTANEIKRDGRFIAYDDGTVLDTKTNLMWAAKDNGNNINWRNAVVYCETYRGGGYTDWRMPTQDELAGLYDETKTYRSFCRTDVHLTELIHLTCAGVWASETKGTEAATFIFSIGSRFWIGQSNDINFTIALPVRSNK